MKFTIVELNEIDRKDNIEKIKKRLDNYEPFNVYGNLSRIYCPKCKEQLEDLDFDMDGFFYCSDCKFSFIILNELND